MKQKQVLDFCEAFYASHYIPIAFFSADGILLGSELPSLMNPDFLKHAFARRPAKKENPSTIAVGDSHYGCIELKKSRGTLVFGPFFHQRVTGEIVSSFLHDNALPQSESDQAFSFLSGVPLYSFNQFINLVVFLHYSLNGELVSPLTHFGLDDAKPKKDAARSQTQAAYESKEAETVHGTFLFEKRLLDLIREGNVPQLKSFLSQVAEKTKFNEGHLASTPLRQAKDIMIGLTTMVGKDAAIRGGLDVEETYQLIDIYTQECEKCQLLEAVTNLQYNMLIDFATRVAKSKTPANLSPEVFEAVQFIHGHTNAPIGVGEIAEHVGKSRSWLGNHFREEMKDSVAHYLLISRLEESKSLLAHGNLPIVEISLFLCFSSQSYFTNVFRDQYGTTPEKYRKRHAVNL
jgi:AraC-like DNA-binding protein